VFLFAQERAYTAWTPHFLPHSLPTHKVLQEMQNRKEKKKTLACLATMSTNAKQ